jgi:hypothetical protein
LQWIFQGCGVKKCPSPMLSPRLKGIKNEIKWFTWLQ